MEGSNSDTPNLDSAADYSTTDSIEIPTRGDISFEARVEALLFVSPGPISVGQLARTLEASPRKVQRALESLEVQYEGRGIRLQKHGSGYQLTTAPELAEDVESILHLEDTSRLSRAALEVLAIIAYQQPVTRPQIDSIRGVNSDSVLRTLLRHGLIEETGRSISPGRPILYSTTSEFLQHFGLSDMKDLPPLDLDTVADIGERIPLVDEETSE